MSEPVATATAQPVGLIRRFFAIGVDPTATAEQRRLLTFHRACVTSLLAEPLFFGAVELMTTGVMNPMIGVNLIVYAAALWLSLRGDHTPSKVVYNYGTIAVMVVMTLQMPALNLHSWFLTTLIYAAAVYRGDEHRLRYGAMALSLALFVWFEWFGGLLAIETPYATPPHLVETFRSLLATGVVLSCACIVGFMAYAVRHTERHLQEEHAKSERLLLNILPQPIAERLKASPQIIADGFQHVTVLFSDIVGFTPMSEKLTPQELVGVLNELFTGFDRIAARHGLEKIKTIGDAYMVAGGLPVPSRKHAQAIAEFALAARDFADAFGRTLDPPVGIRIGMHSGPVVAGVIGETKFAYDLWGDTVNTASRMESSGVSGRIQCSEVTWALLVDEYVFEERGSIAVKGKGVMRTFFLDRRIERAS